MKNVAIAIEVVSAFFLAVEAIKLENLRVAAASVAAARRWLFPLLDIGPVWPFTNLVVPDLPKLAQRFTIFGIGGVLLCLTIIAYEADAGPWTVWNWLGVSRLATYGYAGSVAIGLILILSIVAMLILSAVFYSFIL